MNHIFPPYCRLLGYAVLAFPILFFILLWQLGFLTDLNLQLVKYSAKLIWIMGAILLFFSQRSDEERMKGYRAKALFNGIVLTTFFLFASMMYNIYNPELAYSESSSFLIFLILSNGCFEFYTIYKK